MVLLDSKPRSNHLIKVSLLDSYSLSYDLTSVPKSPKFVFFWGVDYRAEVCYIFLEEFGFNILLTVCQSTKFHERFIDNFFTTSGLIRSATNISQNYLFYVSQLLFFWRKKLSISPWKTSNLRPCMTILTKLKKIFLLQIVIQKLVCQFWCIF